MLKKVLTVVLALSLILILPLTVSADSPFVIDDADLLTGSELEDLNETAQQLSEEYDMDFVILSTDALYGEDIRDFADDVYDRNGYDYDCILLIVAMDEREYYIRTYGDAYDIFTDRVLMDIEDRFLDDLSGGDYYDAFDTFLEASADALYGESVGSSNVSSRYESDYEESYESEPNIFLSLLIGAVVALIAILIMRSQMNTAMPQKHAVGYIRDNSYHLTEHHDMFLYSRVTKTPKPQNNGSSRSGGGSRGGRGGRF